MSRPHVLRHRLIGLTLALALVVLAMVLPGSIASRARGQSAGWQYQVGASPIFGGQPATRTTATLQYTTSGNKLNPSDSGNWYAYWTAGSDSWYSPNWYQVGYGIFQSNNPYGVPSHWVFVQSTADPGYFWCNTAYGFSLTSGALGQPDAGCSGDGDVFGMVLGYSYNFEIVVTNDPASGPNGPIYGCNGNVRFVIGGIEVGHLADCSSGGGMAGISASVLEPTSAYGITPKSATNLYRASELQSSFRAVINGAVTSPSSLSQYCAYSPPAGAGSVITSNVRATSRTYNATCPSGGAVRSSVTEGAPATATSRGAAPTPVPTVGAGTSTRSGVTAAGTSGTDAATATRVYDPSRGDLPALKPVKPASAPATAGAGVQDGRGRQGGTLPPPVPANVPAEERGQ